MKQQQIKPQLPRQAFWILVGHFIRRLLAGEEESDNGMSLGLGAVFAILASPGAFASIFLLDKYSTLMNFFRGHTFNSYRASVADEYFFVVLSMTITGLVMVMRWNKLFPDRRDFANLAVLPIPIRNVFLANFVALFALAVLFAVDVNAFSALFFPFIVTISDGRGGSFANLFRMYRSHAITVILSSLFSFFAVFGLVGLLMLVVPKRLFQPVSLLVRILLVVVLLTEFFANLFLQLFVGQLSNAPDSYAGLLPSYWFLGVYESVAHLATPAMSMLAQRALSATAAAVCISIGCYTLCYRRRFVRLAESLDMVGSSQHRHRMRVSNWLAGAFFPSAFERACASFIAAVLLRSERHLMFLGAYLGIGFVLTAQTVTDSFSRPAQTPLPNSDMLAVPLMIVFFLCTGLRFVFDMPAALTANWIFRSTVENSLPNPRQPVRKIMLLCVLSWEVALVFPLTYMRFGWQIAWLHTGTVIVLSVTLVELLLTRFRKIPFTCSSQPDMRMLIMRILGSVFAVMIFVPVLAEMEHAMLLDHWRFLYGIVLLAIGWCAIIRRERETLPSDRCIRFEDAAPPAFELLKLV